MVQILYTSGSICIYNYKQSYEVTSMKVSVMPQAITALDRHTLVKNPKVFSLTRCPQKLRAIQIIIMILKAQESDPDKKIT